MRQAAKVDSPMRRIVARVFAVGDSKSDSTSLVAAAIGYADLMSPTFGPDFRQQLLDLFLWRRDVRRFQANPLPEGTVERLLGLAALAPSVGLSEP